MGTGSWHRRPPDATGSAVPAGSHRDAGCAGETTGGQGRVPSPDRCGHHPRISAVGDVKPFIGKVSKSMVNIVAVVPKTTVSGPTSANPEPAITTELRPASGPDEVVSDAI